MPLGRHDRCVGISLAAKKGQPGSHRFLIREIRAIRGKSLQPANQFRLPMLDTLPRGQ